MKPLIVVISYNIVTSLGVIRALGAAGYKVDLFFVTQFPGRSKIVDASKYVNRSIEIIGRNEEKIIATLFDNYKRDGEKSVLFPADDYCASLVDRNYEQLSTVFFMPHTVGEKQGSITKLMNKTLQSEYAAASGIPVPKEWIISLNDELTIPDDMVYPCFVKPLVSIDGRKTEMGVCANKSELKNKLCQMQNNDSKRSILVQEFLDISQEYSMSGVCNDQTIILPAIVKKHQIAQYRRGTTLVGEIVPLKEIAPIEEAVLSFLKSIHYIGMFDMEVILANGILYFGELNLRSGGPNYSYYASGINLPLLAVKAICGEEIEEKSEIVYHKIFFHDQDGWEDYQHGLITKKQLNSCYKQADILMLASKDDLAPAKVFAKDIKRKILKSRIKAVLRKI